MRRRWPAFAAGLLAVGLAFAVAPSGRLPGGPLAEVVAPNAVTFSVTARVPFAYGGVQLRNAGPASATIEGVRLLGASVGLRIDSAWILPIADTSGGLWFSHERFPPPGLRRELLQPLEGYKLAPDGAEVQVLLALEVPDEGTFEFRRAAVEYLVEGRRFAATFPFAMRVCAPEVELGGCPALAAGG